MIGVSLFMKKDVYKYTYLRTEDYVLLPMRMGGRLLDVNVCTGEAEGMSDHFLVEARQKVVGERRV